MNIFKQIKESNHKPRYELRDLLKFIGPGPLVTVGFIDPDNWASNIAAGSEYDRIALWIIGIILTILNVMLLIGFF